MKKALGQFAAWIRGPKSDFFLFVVLLVLANLVGSRAFLRLDLTELRSYSLSKASRETVRSIEEPLSVKVFFSSNLPSPYNGAERYLRDLLVEYSGSGNKKFSYEFFDMAKADNQELANSYGIKMAQIQEVKDNEVGLKNAYMGLAIVYSDRIEVLNDLTSTDGLEYKITTAIGKMIATSNSLSGLRGKVSMTLYASSSLGQFGIQGFGDIEKTARDAYEKVNRKSMDKIAFESRDPAESEVDGLAARYGIQKVNWEAKPGSPAGAGTLGIVLEYGDKVRTIPLEIGQGLFGGYGIVGLDTLEKDLSDSLQALMSRSLTVGYVTGHGEKDLSDEQNGSARLSTLVSDMYEFKEIATATEAIPQGITSLVVNGPRTEFTEAELYKIDQFLMRGGNLFLLVDPFEEIQAEGQMALFGAMPEYRPVSTGLERLLAKYGVTLGASYVLDKACYVARQQGTGEVPLYYVPRLARESLNRRERVSRNLADVFFLQAGPIEIADNAASDRRIVPLATSSPEAWLLSENVSLMPYAMAVPPKEEMAKRNLAVLLEGSFDSAFDAAPESPGSATQAAGGDEAKIDSSRHLAKSLQPGKVIVAGTSAISTSAVIDEAGQEPVAVFVRNAIDYLNGNGDLIDMRTKGLGLNTLNVTSQGTRAAARIVNLYGLPALVVVAGFVAWRRRVIRRKRIEARYAAQGAAGKGTEA